MFKRSEGISAIGVVYQEDEQKTIKALNKNWEPIDQDPKALNPKYWSNVFLTFNCKDSIKFNTYSNKYEYIISFGEEGCNWFGYAGGTPGIDGYAYPINIKYDVKCYLKPRVLRNPSCDKNPFFCSTIVTWVKDSQRRLVRTKGNICSNNQVCYDPKKDKTSSCPGLPKEVSCIPIQTAKDCKLNTCPHYNGIDIDPVSQFPRLLSGLSYCDKVGNPYNLHTR